MPTEIEFDPDVFHGELTANRAQVFVRAPRTPELADCTLHGFVHGPRCEYAHTLPARYVLSDLGAGPTLLARATITDPCFWTSDLPQIYDVQVECRRGSEVVASEKRMIGLRGIGGSVTGGSVPSGSTIGQIIREGKIWVPRGVAVESVQQSVEQLRAELLVGLVSSPPLDLLVEASRQGAYLIAQVSAKDHSLPNILRNLSRWPAVMMAIIRGGEASDRSLQQCAPNLVLAQAVGLAEGTNFRPALWASAIVVEIAEEQSLQEVARSSLSSLVGWKLPVIVQRPLPKSAVHPRAECDRLQRDLAPIGQFAGYLLAAS